MAYPRIELYPIDFHFYDHDGDDVSDIIENEDEFKALLKVALQSPKVKRVIAALLRDVND
jgi:hypothetical protein